MNEKAAERIIEKKLGGFEPPEEFLEDAHETLNLYAEGGDSDGS